MSRPTDAEKSAVAAAAYHPYLDGLRVAAAIFVMLHHMRLQVLLPGNNTGVNAMEFLNSGRDAVELFIVLSKYCLATPVVRAAMNLRGGAMGFFRRRAKRILPLFYLAMVLSAILELTLIGRSTGTHWDASLPLTPGAVLSSLLMLQDVWYVSKVNHVFWSIAVEWQIYLWFPALIFAWFRFGTARNFGATVAVSYVVAFVLHRLQHHVHNPNIVLTGLSPLLCALFAVGVFAAEIVHGNNLALARFRSKINWSGTSFLTLATLVICAKNWIGANKYCDGVGVSVGDCRVCGSPNGLMEPFFFGKTVGVC